MHLVLTRPAETRPQSKWFRFTSGHSGVLLTLWEPVGTNGAARDRGGHVYCACVLFSIVPSDSAHTTQVQRLNWQKFQEGARRAQHCVCSHTQRSRSQL